MQGPLERLQLPGHPHPVRTEARSAAGTVRKFRRRDKYPRRNFTHNLNAGLGGVPGHCVLATSSRLPPMDFTGYRKIAATCPIFMSMLALSLAAGVSTQSGRMGGSGRSKTYKYSHSTTEYISGAAGPRVYLSPECTLSSFAAGSCSGWISGARKSSRLVGSTDHWGGSCASGAWNTAAEFMRMGRRGCFWF